MCQIFPPVIYHKHFRYKDRVALERIQITIDSKIANNFAFPKFCNSYIKLISFDQNSTDWFLRQSQPISL